MHPAGIRITRVGTTRDRLGEGPIWDAETRRLFWIDSLAGVVPSAAFPAAS